MRPKAKKSSSKFIDPDGYVYLKKFMTTEHRYIAMQLVGRDLMPNEVVHHINGKKTDNRRINLCLMDRGKHEHLHAWLNWQKSKKGSYPKIADQKQVLENEYGGILLEKLFTSANDLKPESQPKNEAHSISLAESKFFARKNKTTGQFFLEFEDEFLIGPTGKIVEIDGRRFNGTEAINSSNFTEKQLAVYASKLNSQELKQEHLLKSQAAKKQLFIELKKERLKLARENKVPAYLIFLDETLDEIAEVMPVSESLLRQIRGVGPEKIVKYGERFLKVVKNFKSSADEESA